MVGHSLNVSILLLQTVNGNVQQICPSLSDLAQQNPEISGKWPMAKCYFKFCICITYQTTRFLVVSRRNLLKNNDEQMKLCQIHQYFLPPKFYAIQ